MKKSFKFGFTLAEILVALSIIGVVSALVLPSLVNSTQNKKHAAALGRSVEAIETGCQMLVQRANEGAGVGITEHTLITLQDIGGSQSTNVSANSNLFVNASEIFNVTPLTSELATAYVNSVHSYSGGTPRPGVSTIATNFASNPKLGAYYGVRSITSTTASAVSDPITEYIYIDTNGAGSPNRYGIDIFLFGLTDRCYMVPAGSGRMHSLNNNIPTEASGCSGTGSSISNGLSCTSRVVKEGYKNEYKK